jgi:hypothetical protein
MARNTATLIPSTTYGSVVGNYDGSSTGFSSDAYRGDGYYGYADGLHTVSYFVNGFVGVIKIQATLLLEPQESDWFDVDDTSLGDGATPVSTPTSVNFTGNFVWIRATVTDFTAGTINKVQYIN